MVSCPLALPQPFPRPFPRPQPRPRPCRLTTESIDSSESDSESLLLRFLVVPGAAGGSGHSGMRRRGQTVSWASSRQNWRICRYKYHWRLLSRPVRSRTPGLSRGMSAGSNTSILMATSSSSDVFFTKHIPGALASKRKWWYCSKVVVRRDATASHTLTIDSPRSLPTNWAWFTIALPFTTASMSARLDTAVRRKACFSKPKHQSGANFVWPVTRKCSEIDLCWPVKILQAQYHSMKRFLFWPAQLSQCRLASLSPKPYFAKKKSKKEMTAFDPFDTRCRSSMSKLTCFGMASQHTPNRPHFLGTRKYIGSGCIGSLGRCTCWA